MNDGREIFESAGRWRPRAAAEDGFVPLRLRPTSGTGRGPIEVTGRSAVVGRHTDADVRLPAPDVSRFHCRLAFEAGCWRMCDLDSLNGVYVNGERMAEAPLYAGDQLRVGGVWFVVECAAPAPRQVELLKQIAEVLPAAA